MGSSESLADYEKKAVEADKKATLITDLQVRDSWRAIAKSFRELAKLRRDISPN